MNKRITLATAVVLAFCGAARAETLEVVQTKIHDIVSKYKSLQFRQKYLSEYALPDGGATKIDVDTRVEAARKGDAIQSRVEAHSISVTKASGYDYKTENNSLSITDGKDMWSITNPPHGETIKKKHDPKLDHVLNFRAGWKAAAEDNNFKLLADETVDGKPCWAISQVPKEEAVRLTHSKTITYYDKKTGLGVKAFTFGPGEKKVGETIMSDIKIDAEIPAERFTYTPPDRTDNGDDSTRERPGTRGNRPGKQDEKPAPDKKKD